MDKAHIISHTHWDREWYLPYEKHHMLLVEFMDTLIETLEKDPEYKSFHLDGQTIILEDYLQVRPERKKELEKLVQEGRMIVGPWYILQDEFLTSSEANVRNLQIGHKDAKRYGKVSKVGYFPDSFGNMGQAPQILKEAGIDTAVFGRGVKPTGFNNQVGEGEAFESPYSEMYWESKDGSRVLGILFANWYNNGSEIPVEDEMIKPYWDKKLRDTKVYASTPHLLFMNGCDHQPVQIDLSEALNKARVCCPEVEFIHSNFEEYIEAVKDNLPEELKTIKGELRSQQTDGWYTLANTASARIYIKQMNHQIQMMFEKLAEPLATMAYDLGNTYPHHLFEYGWKLLMQNHPHDSICGCSVDSVHREMVTRFEKAQAVAQHIIDESMDYLLEHIDTSELKKQYKEVYPVLVVNPTGWIKTDVATVEVKLGKKYFSEGPFREGINEVNAYEVGCYQLVDEKGNIIPATIQSKGIKFGYDLPKDKFRQPYTYQSLEVSFEVKEVEAFSLVTLALVEAKQEVSEKGVLTGLNTMENDYLKVLIDKEGQVEITHKESGHTFSQLGVYEDSGDIGNEYIYKMPVDEVPITTKESKVIVEVVEDTSCQATIKVTHEMLVPARANEVLDEEIRTFVEFKERKAKRVEELVPFKVETYYTLEKHAKLIKVKVKFNNNVLDHRLRVLFETGIHSDVHYADSIFEVAKRESRPSGVWENPCHAQHQQVFVNIHNEEVGLTIASKGLHEYEIVGDERQIIALTLHRGVRELGDWGVFETPEAQCLGERQVEFAIIPHGGQDQVYESYVLAHQYTVPLVTGEAKLQSGVIKKNHQMLGEIGNGIMYSSLKVNERSGDLMLRGYNLKEEKNSLKLETQREIYLANLLEEYQKEIKGLEVGFRPAQIRTIGIRKK